MPDRLRRRGCCGAWSSTSLAILAAMLAGWLTASPASAQQPGPTPVGTIAAARKPITRAAEFVGRVEAVERVEIRARITGYLDEVLFKDGDFIKQGTVLYRIEPETFQAAVLKARGQLLEAQANFTNAAAQRARTQELVKTNTAPQSRLDERIAAEKSAQGDVIIAQSNLDTATVNLGYTQIVAPITGEIGRSLFTRGNVVSPESGPLTVMVSRDPMYVTFPVSQREFLKVQERSAREKLTKTLLVRIRFSDGTLYPESGRIDFVNVTVDRATDTVLMRAQIPNPQGALIDGQLVRVSLEGEKPEERVLVPQAALIADQQGVYVFVVENGKAVVRRVKLGGETGPDAIIASGLEGGEQVVVQGMDTLRPGAAVAASPAAQPPSRS
ncbi:MAG TPA: efflux RND transporter periplasmic adaptor subunit [Acetobacteraceae bacterium]|nr:efflux RND transporter periplasmic adaptor subunit [Acetobacteraceae bacterium]